MKGFKKDQGKQRWDLLDIRPISEVVDVLTFGANKYSDDNWKQVPNKRERYYSACMRHLSAWRMGEPDDSETGKSHLSHAICCLIFIWCFDKGNDKT